MGQKNSKNTEAGAGNNDINSPPEVTFDDFEVLRAIGRGAFGKVIMNFLQFQILQLCNNILS